MGQDRLGEVCEVILVRWSVDMSRYSFKAFQWIRKDMLKVGVKKCVKMHYLMA